MVFKCIGINFNCQNRSKNRKIRLVESRLWFMYGQYHCVRLCSVNALDLKDKESGDIFTNPETFARV